MAEILIVEDAPLQQALIERFVRTEHSVVGHAETTSGAIELATEHEPDVAIIDIGLKQGNGITAADRIKSVVPGTSVIVSTANVSDSTEERIRSIPVDGYLIKPYSKGELLETIERTMA